MYSSLTLHTDATLEAGQKEMKKYNRILKVLRISIIDYKVYRLIIINRNTKRTTPLAKAGISQRHIHTYICLMIFGIKEPHATSTPSPMNQRIAP